MSVLAAAALLLLLAVPARAGGLPSFAEVRAGWRPSEVTLVDRHGAVVHEQRLDPTRRRLAWTPLSAVSPALRAAVLESEDRRFPRHRGVDGGALAAAALARLTGAPPRGGSTLTMQLVAFLDPGLGRGGGPRTLAQKWRQIRRALALETRWSKDEVLEAYLNLVTFRGELQGIAAAAAVLFDKAPHGLTDAESAVLAALLRGPAAAPATLERRARAVLRATGGAPAALAPALARALEAPRGTGPRVEDAPHAARRLLRGRAEAARVATTLDAGLQRLAAALLRQHLLAVGDGRRGAPEGRVDDGAVLVVDNASGDVLAYVGSSGDLSPARHVDGVQAPRQAGSALKPFLYAAALDARLLTPASLLDDTPLEIAVAGGLYRPRNYDEAFRGPVSARTALAASLNVPAVRAVRLLGEETLVQRLRALGFDGLREPGDHYGPALALGAADVTLWQAVGAYRALARGGVWTPLRLEPGVAPAAARRGLSPEAAFVVADVLADRESRTATFGLENSLATPFWTAVKTGTSKDMRDNWCVGFSRRYTVGVWVGNFSGAPMGNVTGVTGAAPVWLDLMRALHRREPSAAPPPPAGVVARRVDAGAGEPPRREWFLAGTEPPDAAAPALAAGAPRIVTPVAGTIVALDPEIPAAHQRILLEATGAGDARLVLDGIDLGPAARPLLWPPHPGRHTLALRDARGVVRDELTFVVRGRAPRD